MSEKEKEIIDLLTVITKPLEECSDEELEQYLIRIRDLRKVRITKKKIKSKLDLVLDNLNIDQARILLAKIKEEESKEEKREEEEREEREESDR